MRDSDELVSSSVLEAPLAAPRCNAGTGALGRKSDFFRPLPNLLPSLRGLALFSLLLCVAIKYLLKKEKADFALSLSLTTVCPLLIVRHSKLCDAYFSISCR